MPLITPNIWFDTQAMEAAECYVSIFPNSTIDEVSYYGPDSPGPEGEIMSVNFTLDGQPFTGINGGPMFQPDEAISFLINCADQAEIDRYWEALTADGGEESQCGWLKDRFGVSWQVVPANWAELAAGPDRERANRAMQAVFGMRKIDIAAIEAAADGAT